MGITLDLLASAVIGLSCVAIAFCLHLINLAILVADYIRHKYGRRVDFYPVSVVTLSILLVLGPVFVLRYYIKDTNDYINVILQRVLLAIFLTVCLSLEATRLYYAVTFEVGTYYRTVSQDYEEEGVDVTLTMVNRYFSIVTASLVVLTSLLSLVTFMLFLCGVIYFRPFL